eukprot:RCo041326
MRRSCFRLAARLTWRASETVVTRSSKPVKLPPIESLVFGQILTNHMFECDWEAGKGWGTPRIVETHDLSLSPACSTLHYALECFEGLKAYIDGNGKARLFRPDQNFSRMATSLERISLPSADPAEMLESCKRVVLVDKEWIPRAKGYSLYLRPTCISTHRALGIAPPTSALFFIVMSPVGPYYKDGFKPIRLIVEENNVRAWKGGTGQFKLGCNYGPTVWSQVWAAGKGYNQVLWLNDGVVTEVGSMNFMVLWKNRAGELELITAPLTLGTILPGVTRDSVLALCREWKEFRVTEEAYTIDDLVAAHAEGRIVEVFGTGTAAIVSQVSCIHYKGKDYNLPCPSTAKTSLAVRVMEEILAIQYGDKPHPWSVVLD